MFCCTSRYCQPQSEPEPFYLKKGPQIDLNHNPLQVAKEKFEQAKGVLVFAARIDSAFHSRQGAIDHRNDRILDLRYDKKGQQEEERRIVMEERHRNHILLLTKQADTLLDEAAKEGWSPAMLKKANSLNKAGGKFISQSINYYFKITRVQDPSFKELVDKAWYELGKFYEREKNEAEAIRYYEKANDHKGAKAALKYLIARRAATSLQ